VTVRLAGDFQSTLTEASKSTLLELARTLKPYSQAIVLVGGWVPYLLIEENPREGPPFSHVGSIDIDFVIDPGQIGDDEYRTVVELIHDVGWRDIPGKRFSFERTVPQHGGRSNDIQVDFLTCEPASSRKAPRHRKLQADLEARTMRGAELALAHRAPRRMQGTLPGGAETDVELLMLDVVGCLGTKGIALGERFKQKDAYDIVSILDNYGKGVSEIAGLVRPFASEPLLSEALEIVATKFRTEHSEGPVWYAEFIGGDPDAQARASQRAHQLVSEFASLVASG
jgi:hypothetical protein